MIGKAGVSVFHSSQEGEGMQRNAQRQRCTKNVDSDQAIVTMKAMITSSERKEAVDTATAGNGRERPDAVFKAVLG